MKLSPYVLNHPSLVLHVPGEILTFKQDGRSGTFFMLPEDFGDINEHTPVNWTCYNSNERHISETPEWFRQLFYHIHVDYFKKSRLQIIFNPEQYGKVVKDIIYYNLILLGFIPKVTSYQFSIPEDKYNPAIIKQLETDLALFNANISFSREENRIKATYYYQ